MEVIVVILLIGVAAYFLLRHATERGTNTVRAYLYLRAINGGASVQEANDMAQIDLSNNSHLIPVAKEYGRVVYSGKQLPMIEEARRLGFSLNGNVSRVQTQAQLMQMGSLLDDGHTSFDAYKTIFVAELKRLSGKASTDVHWIELTDYSGIRRAFADGVEPKALALAFHRKAKPPLI